MTVSDKVQVAVAAMTFLLAAATFLMAIETRRMATEAQKETHAAIEQVRVAENQVEVSTAAMQATIRPWLTVPVPATQETPGRPNARAPHIWRREDIVHITVVLENVGNGLAMIHPNGVWLRPRDVGPGDGRSGFADFAAVGPGRFVTLSFEIDVRLAQHPWIDIETIIGRDQGVWGEFCIDVSYTDASAGQPVRAEVRVANTVGRPGVFLAIYEIDYYLDGDDKPTSVSRFRT